MKARLWIKNSRYYLESLLVKGIFSVFRRLSFEKASAIGGAIARRIGPYIGASRTADRNLQRALPALSQAERQKIIGDMWENLGRIAAELPHIAHMSKEALFSHLTVEGIEQLEALNRGGKGALLFTAHIGNWEIGPAMAAHQGVPISLVYRAANNPHVDKVIDALRRHHPLISTFPKGARGAKQIMRVLKEGGTVAMLVDQKMNDGIAVPFFGRPAMTAPALARLALHFDCPIIPVRVLRTASTHFTITLFPPLTISKTENNSADVLSIMTQVNAIIEGWIHTHPAQWFWVHNRWPKE